MVANRCTLCDCILTEANSTEEHIIPNAIGGRRKVSGFICETCNHDTGSKWDAELARQLNPLSLYLGIRRQRGTVPSQTFPTASGGSVLVNADGTKAIGRPEVDVTEGEDTTTIHVSVRDRKQFRQHLRGFLRNNPQLSSRSLEDLLSFAQEGSYYSSDPIEIGCEFGARMQGGHW